MWAFCPNLGDTSVSIYVASGLPRCQLAFKVIHSPKVAEISFCMCLSVSISVCLYLSVSVCLCPLLSVSEPVFVTVCACLCRPVSGSVCTKRH